VVSLDSFSNHGGAGDPGFLVPAAAELSRHDQKERLDEVVDVRIRDVFLFLDLVQTFEVGLERLRVVKEGDCDVESAEGAKGEGAELTGIRVVAADLLEAFLDRGGEVERDSPDGHGEVLPRVSVRVGARPLGLDLYCGQVIAGRSQ